MTLSANPFFDGAGCFFRGIGLLWRRRTLWPYALAPFVIGSAVLVWGLVWAFGNLGGWIASWTMTWSFVPPDLQAAAYWAAAILLWPAFLVALFFCTYLFTKIVASPFHALLAERALIELNEVEDRPFELMRWLRVSVRMFLVSILKTGIFATVGAALFVASFVPFLNVIAAFGFLLIVAFDSTDYAFEALQWGLRERVRFFRDHITYFFGFAAALGLVFFVPGFNFLLFPAAVVGGSELVHRILRSKAEKSIGRGEWSKT